MKSKECPAVLLAQLAEQVSLNPELKEAKGHIGPALLPAQHVMRLRFVDGHSTSHSSSTAHKIFHVVTKVGDTYELSTLVTAATSPQEGFNGDL